MTIAIRNGRVNRFAVQAVFSAVASACVLAPAGGQTAKPSSVVPRTDPPRSTSETASSAKVIPVYRAQCLECHDIDGRGEVARHALKQVPDFTDSTWHASRSDAELSRSILEGKGKSMPKMKDKLGALDVKEMVAFIRAFKDGKQVVPEEPDKIAEPEKSGALATTAAGSLANRPNQVQRGMNKNFQKLCSMCHAATGDGSRARDSMRAIPNFTDVAWHGRRTDPQLAVSILDGKGTEMPPFRGKLSREQVRELVAFIRGFTPALVKASPKPTDDFEARFRTLEKELDELRKQSRALSAGASSDATDSAKPTQPLKSPSGPPK
jgi:mono/diheme cytochrome c family protein